MSERTGLPTGGWPQMQDGSCWSDTDQSEARPTKKTSSKHNKDSGQTAAVDNLDDFTESSETASEDHELQGPDSESILCAIEHLRLECKDTASLLKIRQQQTDESTREESASPVPGPGASASKMAAPETEAEGHGH